ncbi:MAG: hypothetical protein V2B18_21270 [Pseudomonadota bacterium]
MTTGWKTNTGAGMVAVGGVLVSMADSCPLTHLVYWIRLVGSIMVALGGSFAVYGLGDKIDRGNVAAKADRKQIQRDE